MCTAATNGRIPTTAEAVAASVACARSLGLPADDPEVIAEGYAVRVRLHPASVVTRVVTVGRVLRGDPMPWLEREVAVARFLAAASAPVVPLWSDPGPYVADGLEVSLWQWAEHAPGKVAPAVFGVLLGELHAALASYEGDLPPLVGPLTDISSALALSADAVLHAAAGELVPLALSWARRPLHGDAHPGNVLLTADGPRWTDFEDVCLGPVEWDLASMQVTDDAVAAYPGHVDRARLAECRDLRRLQTLAGVLTDDVQDASLYDELVNALRRRM
ncbi:MAG: phosphotransferase [Mycobacteriales bacterium]